MNWTELFELAALDAVGALDTAGKARLEHVVGHDAAARADWIASREAIAEYAASTTTPSVPAPGTRERLFARIRTTPQLPPPRHPAPTAATAATDAPPPGFSLLARGDEVWTPTAVPGFSVRVLSVNPAEKYRMLLGRLEPGTAFPRHRHVAGPEHLYLVSGDLVTEGIAMVPGDFVRAEPGTDHRTLFSPTGCVALIVEPIDGPEFAMA